MKSMRFFSVSGFTLIELLIVVAIISVLVVLAIPRFNDAQLKAKIALCQANLKVISDCLERYRLDYGEYFVMPSHHVFLDTGDIPGLGGVSPTLLTTPNPYMSAFPPNPFWTKHREKHGGGFGDRYAEEHAWEYGVKRMRINRQEVELPYYCIESWGPDDTPQGPQARSYGGRDFETPQQYLDPSISRSDPRGDHNAAPYDATNGLKSPGDIYRFGPGGGPAY